MDQIGSSSRSITCLVQTGRQIRVSGRVARGEERRVWREESDAPSGREIQEFIFEQPLRVDLTSCGFGLQIRIPS